MGRTQTESPWEWASVVNIAYCLPEFSVSRVHQPGFFVDECLKMQNDPTDQM